MALDSLAIGLQGVGFGHNHLALQGFGEFDTPAPPSSGGGYEHASKGRRLKAMQERAEHEQRTQLLIQAIVAMVTSGALDE